ncbi:hypothetical protein CTI12_AA197010 [Artemisia annua]|uniref:Uncharacterized protein n=1 Tax=Artemisia annua TaxID=35608 RepID=A0A2U1P3W9_ARTAN|nr:hypothetical protein CTI12_AA197010 [Artemisia annua]
MAPSPALRRSPGREPRVDNHKRGRSFESGGVLLKQRDDDLALFKEVQSRGKDNFLLEGNNDFEDIFTNKLRHFSDNKLGINIPARGESSDLLHAEEKNDYEWLLTPPDTPLFRSLDDEAPRVDVQRGRPRTQPISISRSSTMEKSQRSSRGSASPNRVSVSPQSHNSTFEGRGRASSAPSASPSTHIKPATTSLRKSSPSRKPSSPVPRSSTPTNPRRLSTGSTCSTSSRGSRGSSPSPKINAWQSTIPGFSTEVPPNLRTSLEDRPASYVRGSSPASRNSRQSMSPTASRSISSSHSKGSFGSSVDDDMESFSSALVASRQRFNSRRGGGFQNNNKPRRTVSSSSAPKRSFDLALRQMDHKKGPQNMFRPLLSSVPSSTIHVGLSMNSSVATSSNASSGIRAHNAKTSHNDATSGYVKMQGCDVDDDEVFVIEKDDALNDGCHSAPLHPATLLICSQCGCEYSPIGLAETDTNLCEGCVGSHSTLTITEKEGVHDDLVEDGHLLSEEREAKKVNHVDFPNFKVESVEGAGSPITAVDKVSVAEVKAQSSQHDGLVKDGHFLSEECEAKKVNHEMADFTNSKVESLEGAYSPLTIVDQVGAVEVKAQSGKHDDVDEDVLLSPESSLSRSQSEKYEGKKVNHEMVNFSKSKVESLGAGISILLKRSSSIKGAVVRNTNFSASSMSYDDLSYVRDTTISMRSVSASSSVDFGVNKQSDTRFQRQLSSTRSEIESYKYDQIAKHQRSGSSLDSFEKNAQENNEKNETCSEKDDANSFQATLNQTHVEEAAEFQKAEDVGPDDINALESRTYENASTDVAEVLLDAISEGECDQMGQASAASKCDDNSSLLEELQDVLSSHPSNIIEESIVLVEQKGLRRRSLTLEEATDTILFCSSIVHSLARNAATIAIEKENAIDPLDEYGSWPLIPATRKSDLHKSEYQSRNTTKRSSQSHKPKQEKEPETEPRDIYKTETEGKTEIPRTRIVGFRDLDNGESKKPPMLESKCNCIIM